MDAVEVSQERRWTAEAIAGAHGVHHLLVQHWLLQAYTPQGGPQPPPPELPEHLTGVQMCGHPVEELDRDSAQCWRCGIQNPTGPSRFVGNLTEAELLLLQDELGLPQTSVSEIRLGLRQRVRTAYGSTLYTSLGKIRE